MARLALRARRTTGKDLMLNGRNIICFSNDWRNDPTSKHQIMRILSKSNRIIWVNSIGLRNPSVGSQDIRRIIHKLMSFFRGLERVNENLYVYTPIVIPFHRIGIIRAINAVILRFSLKAHIKRLGMKDIICWSYLPNTAYIIRKLDPDVVVYHCVDEWSKFSFIDGRIIQEEYALCEMADLVIASARTLYESRRSRNPNTHYIPHGVDYEFFHSQKSKDTAVPDDLSVIPRPIAGFFGLIHEWIDLDLLAELARKNEHISFVFIGKRSINVERVAKYPNVYFLGQKSYDELPSYAKHFDVGLIPFRINELTINVNPIKLKEYLALNIPVISVNLPEVAVYERVIRISEDYDQFDAALKEEMAGRHKATPEQLDQVAKKETWDMKVEEISDLITGLGTRKGASA